MDHQTARELFNDHLDRELPEAQEAELREHLSGCEACRAELEELRRTVETLSRLHRVAPPAEFVGKVQQRIRRRSRGRFFAPDKLFLRIPFEWISFVIILIMLVVYLMTIAQQSTPVPAPKAPAGSGQKR